MTVRFVEITDMHPMAKQRPRVGVSGSFYTPKASLQYERKLRERWLAKYPIELYPPFDGPVSMTVRVAKGYIYIAVDDETTLTPSVLRSDLDNVIKAIGDGLNGAAFYDDKQVHAIAALKT